ncbi:MAG: hypothetical protein WBL93_11235 [Lutisporaceae bacterium]
MESIILFALIAIGSTVFKAIKQDAEKQRKAQTAPQSNIQNIQPAVNTNTIQSNLNTNMGKKKGIQSNTMQEDASNNSNNRYGENIRTKAMEDYALQESNSREEEAIYDSGMTFINFGELQRSIIMAEVLGKPKAFKKSIR